MPDIGEYVRARTTTERHGAGVLTLVDRMPEEASGYLLAHDPEAGPIAAAARRVAPMTGRLFVSYSQRRSTRALLAWAPSGPDHCRR